MVALDSLSRADFRYSPSLAEKPNSIGVFGHLTKHYPVRDGVKSETNPISYIDNGRMAIMYMSFRLLIGALLLVGGPALLLALFLA